MEIKSTKQEFIVLVDGSKSTKQKLKASHFWNIFCDGARAGKAYITVGGKNSGTPFVTVMINKKSRGRGIGTAAFESACSHSGLNKIFAEVRRGNKASQRALRKAGFVEFGRNASGEDILMWEKPI
jgi:RimJ/RimL family protein N-acetyltransferase